MAKGRRNDVVSVLESDPELAEDLSEDQLRLARSQAYATSRCYARGRWTAPTDIDSAGSLGLLVLRGYIAHWLTVAGCTSAELLGPGDLLQPWLAPPFEQSQSVSVEWTVIQAVRIIVLDRSFVQRVSTWPEIVTTAARRLTWRTQWLAFQLALSAQRRMEDRVMMLLWQFAQRWGTVTPEGVLLDVPLTHELLASIIGSRRPSVSAAVGRLVERGQLRPRPRSRWLLLGMPWEN